ncbi:MAG: hypothetical protein NTV84_04555 [Methanoregula sp.]|nr:hypothetical protein [Methanoregula sp.]
MHIIISLPMMRFVAVAIASLRMPMLFRAMLREICSRQEKRSERRRFASPERVATGAGSRVAGNFRGGVGKIFVNQEDKRGGKILRI